ncbi:MAG: glycosyltransferase family 2 protein [Patescibacteria group bacterium]|nr:glycosyltransferase family 2 protein [Patescibacteria group bacterium]
MINDYLKIGQSNELSGKNRKLYRALEILPGALSWLTLILLLFLSYLKPVLVAYFLIAFDIYWLLLVVYLAIHLLVSFKKMKKNMAFDWEEKCNSLEMRPNQCKAGECLLGRGFHWQDLIQLVIFPIYNESNEVIEPSLSAIKNSPYPNKNIIIVLTVEERGGEEVWQRAQAVQEKYQDIFKTFYITRHPDGIKGELKGKGSNQAWAAEQIQKDLLPQLNLDSGKILVNVFDIDTIISPYYFHCLSYNFLTVAHPYRSSYQPIPVYYNNIWQSPFFARVAASSNTFWQMMQQIRQEKLATYSSHSMSWKTLKEIGFWSKTMVSEDSRIFWHCFCYYHGDYRVEPLHISVSMDVCMDKKPIETAKNLYKQQRRWGWGVENLPYLLFNLIKNWRYYPKGKFIRQALNQLYGFHSWATNALIIAVIGWMPMLLGGDRFNSTVLSTNLPVMTRYLMTAAMSGLVLSAILSTLLLPQKPKKFGLFRYFTMLIQWLILPLSIIIFGSIPGLEAQTRMMRGGKWRLGFFVTPKSR